MIEINWNNFRAKFNGKEQKSFETLCYLLFCDEFNQKTGIFRYKNQTGIETEPIEIDGKWIGFQSKFYETRISVNKEDIKDSIKKAKEKNSKLNKILFYINQEFSESNKKDEKEPEYKKEIEKYATSQDIEIEWRVPSHFEAQLSLEKNKTLAQHFFSLGKSIIDFISELTQHSESILTPIRSKIEYNRHEIKIDRMTTIESLKNDLAKSSLLIISGEGGIGKTAVIKDFYDQIKETTPLFIFKATEFNISHINDLLKNYGNFTLSDFIKEYQDIDVKYLVIDSAEKLSDIENREIFQEYLSSLLNNGWKVIFTTRYSYLDDLKFQFIEVYGRSFHVLNIDKLKAEELAELSKRHNFDLPGNERLLMLLQNPFYLNEYLQNYENLNKTQSLSDFINILWNKQILKSSYRKNNTHLKREDCFLSIAQKRANEGHFFVMVDDCEQVILQNLEDDEIIKYDSNAGGYFITHDIYEEWALDKIIERSFSKSKDYISFLAEIGSSLPIRRAFRNWLSEKLLTNKNEVISLIENTINDHHIARFWKDEIIISVLLSDYAETFFQLFKDKLLEDNQNLLLRIIFLLRIACKEIDESFLNLLGLQKTNHIILKTLFSRPKGRGWNCTIDFIHKHKEEFGLRNINIILPLLDDWNNKIKEGKTTKKAGQIGLYFYDEITKEKGSWYGYRGEKQEQLIRVILHGASELTNELKAIFDEVISEKKTNRKDKYYELIQTILTSLTDNFEVVKCFPQYVIKLAGIYWFQNPDAQSENSFGYSRMNIENYFCISPRHTEYFPSSAFQTPIYQLLRFASKETIDFILLFTNKCIGCYATLLKDEVEEVEIFINENERIKQYISNRLWNMYRGTQDSTNLLESIHMALEKWLFENAKSASKEILESWCLYLIKNSKSASITAVVTSIVLAEPSKLFNIAKILFRTKELFLYDTNRLVLDQSQKSQLLSLRSNFPGNYKNEIHEQERINACDDTHRKFSLEHIAVNYQFFKTEEESDNEAEQRQKIIWAILDEYYEKLPDKSKETEDDKTWRLYLARMDRRRMNPEVDKKDGQVLIKFNPEIDPELKKYSEDALKISNEPMKYTALKLWSRHRLKKEEDKYSQYHQYESNPHLVLQETKEIIEKLKEITDNTFFLFNHSIPAYTCSVLIRDFCDKLNSEEKAFCKEIIIEFASAPIKIKNYHFQISDGTEPSIMNLPELFRYFNNDKDKKDIKLLLFLLLIHPWYQIQTYVISGIFNSLWNISFEDAHSIFLGYLLLAPRYNDVRERIHKENYQKQIYETSKEQILEIFLKDYKKEIEKIILNKIKFEGLDKLEQLELDILKTAFELLPLRTKNEDHKKFLNIIFPIFSKKLFMDNDRVDYTLKHRFLKKLAYFILTSTKDEIKTYLKPFVENFSASSEMADFFEEFVSAEDRLNQYEEFWIVWDIFSEKIKEICKKNHLYHYAKKIIHNYLLAWPYWKEDAKEWHTLKEREKLFFKKVADELGHCPPVLYSISKILNDIGSKFIEDGIDWISNILQKNENLLSAELETNTIFYIENIVRKYVFVNRQKIRTNQQTKKKVIVILNFLIENGSITGYLLREDIL